jgi:hypothetical protein
MRWSCLQADCRAAARLQREPPLYFRGRAPVDEGIGGVTSTKVQYWLYYRLSTFEAALLWTKVLVALLVQTYNTGFTTASLLSRPRSCGLRYW